MLNQKYRLFILPTHKYITVMPYKRLYDIDDDVILDHRLNSLKHALVQLAEIFPRPSDENIEKILEIIADVYRDGITEGRAVTPATIQNIIRTLN